MMRRLHRHLPLLLVVGGALPLLAVGNLPALKTAEEAPIKPLRGLVYTETDIPKVRRQALENHVNAALVEDILRTAAEWKSRSDDEIAALIPPPGSVFAYGMAGDPKTNQAWPRFAREGDMCRWDRPGTVRSPHTGDIYGAAKPGEPYYDAGTGWTRESDGQVFYFKGIWNSWVVDRLHEAVDNLSLAYLLTGDADLARRALFILDRLATLKAQLPMTGSSAVDWPHKGGDTEAKGFFHYMGNIANQRTINTALAFDLIANAPFSSEPSAGNAALTVRDNITKNYFAVYERRYLNVLRALTNHGIILIGNLLTQGVLFGDPAMLREGLDGMQGFFDNTINRDGDYMEVSGSYGRLGREYGSRLIMPLSHYDTKNYPKDLDMPDLAKFTSGPSIWDDPQWFNTAVRMLYRLPVVGRYPQYGDMSMDRSILIGSENDWLAKHRALFLRVFYHYTSRQDWQHEIETLYPKASVQEQSSLTVEDLLLYGPALWTEPGNQKTVEKNSSAPEPKMAGGSDKSAFPQGSDLMAAKGIAILRGGDGDFARALFLRGGINSWHGHDDQMSLVPYGHGMVLFGEFGYRWAGTPDNLGWGSRSVAHNMVIVDEDLPAPYLYKGFSKAIPAPAASITAFIPEGTAQLIEMRNPKLWSKAKLSDYRRTAWLIDIDPEHYYFADIFQIIGGRTHDYVWNAPYIAQKNPNTFQVENIEPKSQDGVWTLASVSGENRQEAWNQPGQSWGERLSGENGMVRPLPGEKSLPISKWNPQPGNGYGMIWDVKLQDTKNDWKATWPLPDNQNFLRAHLLNLDGMTAITALSPSMTPGNPFNVIVGRRTRDAKTVLHSRFVNIVEVGRPNAWSLTEVNRLPLETSGEENDAVGVRIKLTSGKTDYLLSSRSVQSMSALGGLRVDGRNGFIRLNADGQLAEFAFQEGTRLEAGGWTIEVAAPVFQSRVLAVHPGREESRLIIADPLPSGQISAGTPLGVNSSTSGALGYTHNDYFSLEEVKETTTGTELIFHNQSLKIASLQIESVDLENSQAKLFWKHTLAGPPGGSSYQGRAVVPTGKGSDEKAPPQSLVRDIDDRTMTLTQVNDLKAGERIDVLVAKPGDILTMPSSVTLTPVDGEAEAWHLRSNMPVRVTFPTPKGSRVKEFPAGESRISLSDPS